jgi:hypothetical protein
MHSTLHFGFLKNTRNLEVKKWKGIRRIAPLLYIITTTLRLTTLKSNVAFRANMFN